MKRNDKSMGNALARLALLPAVLVMTFALGACGKGDSSKNAAATKQPAQQTAKAKGEGKDGHREEGALKLSDEEIKVAGIQVAEVAPQDISGQVVLTAVIRANQDRIAHVAPRVAARITRVNANLGDKVKAGQALALLDSIELGEANSAYQQAQSQHAVARADFERAERLKADQIIAEKDYLRARGEYAKATAQLRAAADRLRLLDVTPSSSASGNAESVFPLKAPFAGTVIEKHAILGELAPPDKNVFTVADLSNMWIEANLLEKDLSQVKVGVPARVSVSAYPGETFAGKLTYIAATLDRETRTVQARIEVPNADGRLKPEMFATAAIDTAARGRAMLLPQAAVVLVNGQPTVFIEEHGGFEPRAIETGETVGGRLIVKNGLKDGERVVIGGAYALKARLLKSQIGDSH